jgi:WD40 repeat protein
LDVPGEILSAITANLDPPALLALGESHISLSRHIGDDATWRAAFKTNLGTGPLLRRVEPTWRKEYFNRHKTLLRFAYSRVPSTTYSPLPAPAISHIHLLSTNSGPTGLLSLSQTYGIVGRSIPFTGRILPGFLDATGSTTGNGLGNLNAEFIPNVSACAIASAGNTVRILWGYRTGHIALMVTNRTLESPRRPAQEFRVSQEDEKHHGSVLDLMWINDHDLYAVSAGRDGKVKLWDYAHHNTPDLIWVSTTLPQSAVIPAPCIKVSGNRAQGMVVAVREDRSVDVWRGLDFQIMGSEEVRFSTTALPGPARAHPKVLALHIDPSSGDVLVAFRGEVCFYRVHAAQAGSVTAYGAPEGGAILSSLQPYFPSNEGEESFILTGDKLGCVTAYEWKPEAPSDSTVRPARMFQASAPVDSRQEAITALHWTPAILATGTSGGVVIAWDSLTFEHLRVIVRPVGLRRTPRRRGLVQQQQQPAVGLDEEDPETPSPAVRQILAGDGGDTLIVNVGGEVIAWRAGDISTKTIAKSPLKGGKVASTSTSSPRGTTKMWNCGRVELAESSGRWSGTCTCNIVKGLASPVVHAY